jgi:hypothetical protein
LCEKPPCPGLTRQTRRIVEQAGFGSTDKLKERDKYFRRFQFLPGDLFVCFLCFLLTGSNRAVQASHDDLDFLND